MFKKTYDSITAGLRTMVEQLRDHANEHLAQVDEHRAAAEEHLQHADSKEQIAARSFATAGKIAALLDG